MTPNDQLIHVMEEFSVLSASGKTHVIRLI